MEEVRVDGVDELVLTLRGHGVGRRVVLTYLRDGSEKLAHVVLADRTT